MLLDRIIKEHDDRTRYVYDFDAQGLLDPGETLTLVSSVIDLGETGWSEAPFPAPGAPPPYDPTPLLFHTAVLDVSHTKLVTFVDYGTPGNVYTCVFIVSGTSGRQITCELAVQVTGEPPIDPLTVPIGPPTGIGPAEGVSIYGGTMLGPLYLFENPTYPTEAATKYYVDHVAGATGGPFLSLSGGTMTGPLVLYGSPLNPLDAATREYVDTVSGLIGGPYLSLAGGTLTGDLHFNHCDIISLYTPLDTGRIFRIIGDRQEVDIYATGDENCSAWLYTDNNDGTAGSGSTGQAGLGTGNSENNHSGWVAIYTGNGGLGSGALGLSTGNVVSSTITPLGSSGNIDITTGDAEGSGNHSGDIALRVGSAASGAVRGQLVLDADTITSPADFYFAPTGGFSIETGAENGVYINVGAGSGGIYFTAGSKVSGDSGEVQLTGGNSSVSGKAGGIRLSPGTGVSGANAGDITHVVGVATGGGANGNVFITNLPTADPHVVGALWIDTAAGRVIKSSNG
jgi:hypothetical protein